jgi:valyl-tRNA synthetase
LTIEYPTRFDFARAEPEITALWIENRAFQADPASGREPFVIVIPPPNITGRLHMGHALNNTLQDILTRLRRMQGFEALYLPGTDHAGIATQFAVEKVLAKEGVDRFQLGREKFLERVWRWKEEYGGAILDQLKRLGCSCDWSRTRFTLDDSYARAVLAVFISLFKKGLVYRGKYLVNWCPRCHTALSDLEVAKKEERGHLWHVRYPVEGEPGRFAVMATTRPETILGDTAVARHPDDPRTRDFRGRHVVLPVLGRRIPVVDDSMVDPKFGSGMVKITPAHDFADFECGERHKLPKIQVIDDRGRMTPEAGPFAGMDRFACRKAIVERLAKEGLLEKVEEYTVALGRCYRCAEVLEPYLSDQWFVRMAPLVPPAIDAVERGEIRFHPERYKKWYLDWMTGIKDWCISRQLWWGHRIPVWYCPDGHARAALAAPALCSTCGSAELRQDEDVLDTWFSSALWPFATLGWPAETPDLEAFYPTQVLVTGREIINLWVARMIVTGFEFRGEKPFADVVINAIIQTIEGKRMSKSLGTGLDPLELIDEYGADPLRFLMARKSTGAQDIRLGLPHELLKKKGIPTQGVKDDPSILEARNFVTKVWNACRFVLTSAPGPRPPLPPLREIPVEERWILSRLSTTIRRVTEELDAFEFGRASARLYEFVWDEFCDYTIELAKPRLDRPATRAVVLECVETILKLLHPFAPFVTEAIWQRLREADHVREPLLARAAWPEPSADREDPRLEAAIQEGIRTLTGLRKFRKEMGVSPKEPLRAVVRPRDAAVAEQLQVSFAPLLGNASIEVDPAAERPKASWSFVTESFAMYIPLEGKVDLSRELARQEKALQSIRAAIAQSEKKLANADYVRNAPEEVVEEERERLAANRAQAEEVVRLLADLRGTG